VKDLRDPIWQSIGVFVAIYGIMIVGLCSLPPTRRFLFDTITGNCIFVLLLLLPVLVLVVVFQQARDWLKSKVQEIKFTMLALIRSTASYVRRYWRLELAFALLLASLAFLQNNLLSPYTIPLILVYLYLLIMAFELTPKSWQPPFIVFEDHFDAGLERWEQITGDPRIDDSFGNPAPSLYLPRTAVLPTYSFAYAKDMPNFSNGVIECDVYLEPGSLVNVVFRADLENSKYYMARLDTRGGDSEQFNGILKNDGAGRHFITRSRYLTTPGDWHHMRIELNNAKLSLYEDKRLIASVIDDTYEAGQIAVFNEVQPVHVDNFIIKVHKQKVQLPHVL
jgi:hypothetical protein